MANAILLVLCNAVEGQETRFKEWFKREHADHMLEFPGLVAARVFELTEQQMDEEPVYRFMVQYELDAEMVDIALKVITEANTSGQMNVDESFDTSDLRRFVFAPVMDRRTK